MSKVFQNLEDLVDDIGAILQSRQDLKEIDILITNCLQRSIKNWDFDEIYFEGVGFPKYDPIFTEYVFQLIMDEHCPETFTVNIKTGEYKRSAMNPRYDTSYPLAEPEE